MAEEPAVLAAKERIEEILREFVQDRGEAKVVVVMDDLGHLHAVVASHAFEGAPPRERQDLVRDYLRDHATPEDLAHLYRVFVMSSREYDERSSLDVFKDGATEILDSRMTDRPE